MELVQAQSAAGDRRPPCHGGRPLGFRHQPQGAGGGPDDARLQPATAGDHGIHPSRREGDTGGPQPWRPQLGSCHGNLHTESCRLCFRHRFHARHLSSSLLCFEAVFGEDTSGKLVGHPVFILWRHAFRPQVLSTQTLPAKPPRGFSIGNDIDKARVVVRGRFVKVGKALLRRRVWFSDASVCPVRPGQGHNRGVPELDDTKLSCCRGEGDQRFRSHANVFTATPALPKSFTHCRDTCLGVSGDHSSNPPNHLTDHFDLSHCCLSRPQAYAKTWIGHLLPTTISSACTIISSGHVLKQMVVEICILPVM